MDFEWDDGKSAKNLRERGFGFDFATLIFEGRVLEARDDRVDYGEALERHYTDGPPLDWEDRYVSAYATMHPWEDWAESWAHYLHIHDTLEVAADFGLVGKRIRIDPKGESADGKLVPKARPFDEVLNKWAELTVALNSINRSMGLRDLYPFILSQPVIDKLYFISEVIAGTENPPVKSAA